MHASPATLKLLAAIVWYGGAAALLAKGLGSLSAATTLRPGLVAVAGVLAGAIVVGVTKARLLFVPACRRNLRRIDGLGRPRLWQFYRPRFFLFLALMVMLGMWLSRIAVGRYPLLIGVAALDLSLATALLGGSLPFWRFENART